MIEYKLYITNPMFYGSTQNNFEKNLSGKITINETIAASGMTERTAVGEVTGIPVPFTNPQTNLVVEDNNGKIIKNGEASMFSPPKVLATEMVAIITDEFAVKYGLNIDFSLDPPKEVATTTTTTTTATTETAIVTTPEKSAIAVAVTSGTATGTASTPGAPAGFTFNFDKDKALAVAAVAGGAALVGAGAYALIKNSKDKPDAGTNSVPATIVKTDTKPAVAPIEDNKLKGIRILVPSQYIDVYKISKYGGAPALLTTKDSKQMVWLDKEYDRPEFLPSNLTSPQKVNDDGNGDFGIKIHLGYPGGKKVGNWSEDGSQVFSTADELNDFFKLCETHKEKYGNKLTYTLSTRDDWDEAQKSVQTNNAVPDPGTASTPPAVEEKIAGTPSTPPAEIEEIVITAFRNLNFDTNKSDIRAESFESLTKLAELLKKETSWKLKVEGHTDSDGSAESNLGLSNRRAAATKKYLVDKGVAEGMITTEGFGETKPLTDNKTAENKQKNRRVSLTIIKPDKTTIAAGTTLSETAITKDPVT